MKQFKALLRKEWQTHRFTFLIPSYVVTAFFVFSGLISIYGAIRYGMPDFISIGDTSRIDPDLVIRGMLYSMSVVLGWFCILSSMQSNENMLNGDYVKNCEIMHNSQPVSILKMMAAKLTLSIPLMMIQYALLAVISGAIIAGVLGIIGVYSFGTCISAVLSPLVMIFLSMMSITAIFWLFSCMFRKQAFLKLWISLAVIDVFRLLVMSIWQEIQLFSPIGYYFRIFILPFSMIRSDMVTFKVAWQSIGMYENLIALLVSVLMFIAGHFIYKRRELS
jgi:hypothetical protein